MKTIKGSIAILDCFTLKNPEQGVSEIARKLDMQKSKVSRVLSTFESLGVVRKSPNNHKYHLGPKLLEWATIVMGNTDLRTCALPHMEKLRTITEEAVNIYIAQGDYRICIERLESPQTIGMVSRIGNPVPLNAGAAGKLILAYFTDEKRNDLLSRIQFSKFTENTITNRNTFNKELKKIVQQGYATSFQEHVPIAASLAAPIRNFHGEVIAALTVGGPSMRLTKKKMREFVPHIKEAADNISRELGYRN